LKQEPNTLQLVPSRRTRVPFAWLGIVVAGALAGCVPRAGPAPPQFEGPWGREVTLARDSGAELKAWFRPGRPGAGAVLILHGMGADHRAMIPRAHALSREGFATLLLDFRGHGSSSGGTTTYGLDESADALTALDWLRRTCPGERVAVIGVSMGGAAALLGPSPLDADALVLESVYPTFGAAVRNRLATWLGPLGLVAAPVLRGALARARGLSLAALRPIERIGEVGSPVLVAAGSRDPYTPIEESRALFESAPPGRKTFWEVEGAGHHDLYLSAPSEYLRVVGGFLAEVLRASSTVGGGR
jgi:uncharacterized protein